MVYILCYLYKYSNCGQIVNMLKQRNMRKSVPRTKLLLPRICAIHSGLCLYAKYLWRQLYVGSVFNIYCAR